MAEWVWEARGPTGEVKKGQMEADDAEAVQTRLRQQKLQPTKVKKKRKGLSEFSLGSGVSQKDLVTFTRLLAPMIDAGLPIVQCLDILGNQTDNKQFFRRHRRREIASRARQDVQRVSQAASRGLR